MDGRREKGGNNARNPSRSAAGHENRERQELFTLADSASVSYSLFSKVYQNERALVRVCACVCGNANLLEALEIRNMACAFPPGIRCRPDENRRTVRERAFPPLPTRFRMKSDRRRAGALCRRIKPQTRARPEREEPEISGAHLFGGQHERSISFVSIISLLDFINNATPCFSRCIRIFFCLSLNYCRHAEINNAMMTDLRSGPENCPTRREQRAIKVWGRRRSARKAIKKQRVGSNRSHMMAARRRRGGTSLRGFPRNAPAPVFPRITLGFLFPLSLSVPYTLPPTRLMEPVARQRALRAGRLRNPRRKARFMRHAASLSAVSTPLPVSSIVCS